MAGWIFLTALIYLLSWVWLVLGIKNQPTRVSNEMRTAGYRADDVTMPLVILLLLILGCSSLVTSSAYTVVAEETNRSWHENGHYVKDDPEARFSGHQFEVARDIAI